MGFLIPYFDRVVCPGAIVGVQNQQVSDICFLPAGVDLASQAPQDCARQLHGLSWPPRIKLSEWISDSWVNTAMRGTGVVTS